MGFPSRAGNGASFRSHFKRTGHSFAQHSETQRVWDYRRDRYSLQLAEDYPSTALALP